MNIFEKITESPEALASLLRAIPAIETPWDEAFHRLYCSSCSAADCDACRRPERDITPQPGDVVFYDWQDSGSGDDRGAADHVGIVSSVSGRVLKVIEGNFSNSVKERTLEVNGKYLRGFGLPAYYTKTDNKEDFDMDINEARKQLTSCADTGDTPSAWAKEAAEYCKRKGIFNGDGAGNFGWQQPITREAVACIIYRALEAAGALGNLSDV